MKHLVNQLKSLGLTEKEAEVYLALLQLGKSTPYQIAKKSGLKRPTAYVLAEELVKKNVIVHVPGEKPKKYIARTPDSLFQEVESRLERSREALPELRSLQKEKGDIEKPSILYFDGVSGVKQALMYRIKECHGKEIVSFFANPEYADRDLVEQAKVFNEYRNRHGIGMRAIATDTKELQTLGFEKYFNFSSPERASINAKVISKEIYNSNASFEFYPELVKIIFFDSAQAIVIESSTVARAMRQIFELLWSRIKEGEFQKSKFLNKPL